MAKPLTSVAKHLRPLWMVAGTWSLIQISPTTSVQCKPKLPPSVAPIIPKTTKVSYRRLIRVAQRLVEVVARLFPLLVSYLLKSANMGETKEQWLKRLVNTLASLGPVGIKWGQWASTRYDLFDDVVCEALGELTNCAPMHSFEVTKLMVENSFGKSLSEVFSEFESVAIASGSIAQVHIARLGDKKVAVKVQHPNLSERLDIDMEVLRFVATWAGDRVGQTVDQFSCNFEAQLDFRDEASNLRTFGQRFSGLFWNSLVSFPQPIDGLVSERVLVETFEEGESVAHFLGRIDHDNTINETNEKIENSSELNKRSVVTDRDMLIREQVAQCGMQAFLKMLIWDNFIHADLHPGNVIIRLVEVGPVIRFIRWVVLGDSDAIIPHIVLLDAGLAASFDERIGAQVHSFFEAIASRDSESVARTIIKLGAADQPAIEDPEAFVAEVSQKFDLQFEDFQTGRESRSADNIRSIMQSVRDHHIIVDPAVMIGLMSMVVLEGWQFRLAPDVSVLHSIENAMGGSVYGLANTASEKISRMKQLVFDRFRS